MINLQLFPWLILGLPLLCSGLILMFGRLSKALSSGLAIAGAAVTAILSLILFLEPHLPDFASCDWINFAHLPGVDAFLKFAVPIGFLIDPLSKVLLVLVPFVAVLVFIYSVGYMAHEEGYARYFSALSLFLFSMLGIVLANNLIMLFIFWELVGASSYILIGHYYRSNAAAEACKQAFLVNRIGDFGFMVGILIFWFVTGSVVFGEMEQNLAVFHQAPYWLTVACLCVFCGTIGKSAQMPLHVWLPNSMEGPTPVSSLLHAATMVAAGVYLLARMFPIFQAAPVALEVVGWIGAITCFVAGLMGFQQNDIKRILAYSTISQLGYMVLGIAVAPGWEVAIFHLFNHAFFKCLLFLCAGSVIVGMHHEQDIWKMGALKNKMPLTFLMLLLGGLSLMGFPFLSGSYSKDLIIEWAANKGGAWFALSVGAVFLTALYTSRMLWVVFLGAPRSEAAKHAHESPAVMLVPLVLLAIPSWISGYPWVQHLFFHLPEPPQVSHGVTVWILVMLAAGMGLAFALYGRGPQSDPISIPLFAQRLYIDVFYEKMVQWIQERSARGLNWIDRVFVDGILVNWSARGVWIVGFVLRFFQIGNLQAYLFLFGLGSVALLCWLLALD